MHLLMMLVQAAIVSGPPVPPKAAIPAAPARKAPCPVDRDGAIIVCGEPDGNERYRLRPLPEKYVDQRRIVKKLPGGFTLSPSIEQGRLGDGRIMLTLSIPF